MEQFAATEKARREFLKQLGGILGLSASASILSMASLNSALAFTRSKEIVAGKLLSIAQMQTLAHVCQTIIPKTDTPGAADLDCHGFIDHQLVAIYGQDKQKEAQKLIDAIDDIASRRFKTAFSQLNGTQQQVCLENIENGKWSNRELIQAFKELKYLNAFGYFTSKVGATQVLTYQPVPGAYIPSIPVTANTTNYGSLAFY